MARSFAPKKKELDPVQQYVVEHPVWGQQYNAIKQEYALAIHAMYDNNPMVAIEHLRAAAHLCEKQAMYVYHSSND